MPYWDQKRAFAVVHRHPDIFTQISPMWYSLRRSGEIVLADDEYVQVDKGEVASLRRNGIKVVPTITDLRNGEWAPGLVSAMLSDPTSRRRHIRSIADFVERHDYDGIDVDYESLRARDRENYSRFLTELGEELHANGRMLATAVFAKQSEFGNSEHNAAQDYSVIGRVCDQVRLMTYDYHYSTSEPGQVAPPDWVEGVVRWAVTQIAPERISLGIVLLGYDWPIGGEGETVTYEQAMALAREYGATVERSDPGRAPTFRYTDRTGRAHEVWFEDAVSTEVKLGLVGTFGLGSTFFWRLGGEDPRTWRLPVSNLG